MWLLRKDGEQKELEVGREVLKMLFMKFVNSSVWTLGGLSGG